MSEKETDKSGVDSSTTGGDTETGTSKEITESGVSASDIASLRDTLLEQLEKISKTKESPEKDSEVAKLNQRIDKLTDALVDFGKGITDEIRGKKAVGDAGSTTAGTENQMEVKTPRSGQTSQEGSQATGRGFWRRVLG